MKKFRIVSSQLVYHETYIMAEDEEEANELVLEDDGSLDWKEFHYGDWDIEAIEEVKA